MQLTHLQKSASVFSGTLHNRGVFASCGTAANHLRHQNWRRRSLRLLPSGGRVQRLNTTMAANKTAVNAQTAEADFDFDLITIGGGTAGVRAARLSAELGAKSGLCELPFGLVMTDDTGGTGGTCVLRGCVPKKLMHYVAEYSQATDDAEHSGWDLPGKPTLNFEKMMELKNKELKRLNELYKGNLDKAGVKFFEGRGKVTGPHSVEVNGQEFKVKNILIATGAKATKIPIEGNELAIISDEVLALDHLPKRLAIVGASYIACEQATIYNNLGTDVHMFNRGGEILKGFDDEGRKFLGNIFQEHGININTNTSPTKLEKDGSGKITMTFKKGDKEGTLTDVDQVLFATGRSPNTKGIGLEELGVELDPKGGIKVDKFSRSVSVPSIWAIGDVSNRIPLTPVARMEGNMFAHHLFGKSDNEKFATDHTSVAKVVFSSPQFASVGLSEEEAAEKFKDVDIFTSEFTPMQSSFSKRKGSKALAKLVSEANNGKVLGIHFVGPEAAEIVQGFAVVVKHGLTKEQLDATVGLHPTAAEEFVLMTSPARQYRDGKLWLKQE